MATLNHGPLVMLVIGSPKIGVGLRCMILVLGVTRMGMVGKSMLVAVSGLRSEGRVV